MGVQVGSNDKCRDEINGLITTDMLFYCLIRFLTGPVSLKDPDAKFRFPRIFVNTENSDEELHLIVYKVNSMRKC